MASRLDEARARRLGRQRVVAALTRHDPDKSRPGRTDPVRSVLAGFAGATIIAAGALAANQPYGHNGPVDLRDARTVLIEEETGAQYVYTRSDDRLHPVLNFASGLLLAEGSPARSIMVRRDRLASLRREVQVEVGAPLGIPDAPNMLPLPTDLLREPWQVCTRTLPAAGAQPRTEVVLGTGAVTAGQVLAVPRDRTPGEALLVQAADDQYLIFANRKLLLPEPEVALAAFGWTGASFHPVSPGWVNAVPSGPDLTTRSVAEWGQPSNVLPVKIGRLYRATGGEVDQWAVARRDGLQPVSDLEARLLRADPRTTIGPPVQVSTADFAALPRSREPAIGPGGDLLPKVVPALVSIASAVCVTVPEATTGVGPVLVDPQITVPASAGSHHETPLATGVDVPLGKGSLVQTPGSASAPAGTGTISLVTDTGMRHAIADSDALIRLGYGSSTPQTMPPEVVTLLPEGPALGIAAAHRQSFGQPG
jgi:type VII secretion protein EccB